MARGINKAIIVGTLGHDPSLRYTPSGTPVANFSVATNESWTDKQSGQKQERTEWHNIAIFGKLAEIAKQYLVKGAQAYFEGKLTTEKWQDKNGQDRWTTKIIANEMQMLGSKRDNTQHDNTDHRPAADEATAEDYRRGSCGGHQASKQPVNPPVVDDGFEDIPF